ncbi:hypothetical protein EC973_002626 [Apophysomyces ossiformis]|uniref:Cell wall protein n=1 Tax=Apophysomyces ossiformis TaxID=679940 RepID=A0A8H7EMG3_9FUNG|nr:hypothetical protein EC973_002626 [Apophysomyces ossiformis]
MRFNFLALSAAALFFAAVNAAPAPPSDAPAASPAPGNAVDGAVGTANQIVKEAGPLVITTADGLVHTITITADGLLEVIEDSEGNLVKKVIHIVADVLRDVCKIVDGLADGLDKPKGSAVVDTPPAKRGETKTDTLSGVTGAVTDATGRTLTNPAGLPVQDKVATNVIKRTTLQTGGQSVGGVTKAADIPAVAQAVPAPLPKVGLAGTKVPTVGAQVNDEKL